MTLPEVLDRLAEFLGNVVENYTAEMPKLEAYELNNEPIKVYSGYPPVRVSSDSYTSFICCLADSFEDNDDGGTATVKVVFSLYCPDESDQARPMYNLVEHCRQAMLKNRTLKGRASLVLPLKGEFSLEQPNPQYQATITAVYTIGQPTEEGFDYDGYQETKAYGRY